MKVYFEQSFWDPRENGCIGAPQKVDWEFTYDHQQYQIPTIYLFPEGITIDIISLLDTEKIMGFKEKYENRINNMSEEERLCLEAVHPIPKLPLHKVYINNELAKYRSSCSACSIAGSDLNEKDDVLREIKRENGFLKGKDTSFQCIRVHAAFSKKSQNDMHKIKFVTSKTETLLPINKHFAIEMGMIEQEYQQEFVHPLKGTKHHVYINEVEEANARETFPQYQSRHPFNYIRVSYELVPPLPQDERLLLKEIEQPDEAVTACGAIGIIGSSHGVSIFGKSDIEIGKHGYPVETFFTKLYWKSLKSIEMSIVGIYKEKCAESEIIVYDSEENKT